MQIRIAVLKRFVTVKHVAVLKRNLNQESSKCVQLDNVLLGYCISFSLAEHSANMKWV